MKVLTIKEPWASLIANGYKCYEFRTWKTNYRGYILIHAGKGVDREAMKLFDHLNLKYKSGAIIAKAKIVDCIKVDDSFKRELDNIDPLVYKGVINSSSDEWDGYAFKLENIKQIDEIKIDGKLGLWNYDGKINID